MRLRVVTKRATRTWFCSLSGFIDKNSPKLHFGQSGIPRTNASATNNVGGIEDLPLALLDQSLILPLVVGAQLPLLVLQLNEFLQLHVRRVLGHLLMESQERDGGIKGLSRLRGDTDRFQPRGMDLLGELIHGNIGRRADQNGTRVHFRQMVND